MVINEPKTKKETRYSVGSEHPLTDESSRNEFDVDNSDSVDLGTTDESEDYI